jgi:tyrosinase
MRFLSLVTLTACISQVLAACSSIEVRKEWREFTSDEQAAWISAVKVTLLGILRQKFLTFS